MQTMTQDEAMDNLPQVLEILKRRLLIVMNQDDVETDEDDDLLVNAVNETLQPQNTAIQWDDSKAAECLADTLEKHVKFNLYKYLDSAENVCVAYSDKNNSYPEVYSSMEYILTHAREFGDPNATIFQTELDEIGYRVGSARLKTMEIGISERKDMKIILKVQQMTLELREEYEERKFQSLNAYVTSFVLMILRRSLMNLTDCIFYTSRVLVIEAYLNTTDIKTRNNLRDTCVKYMEWYDLQMPYLFCKALDVYKIEGDVLWDLLSSVKVNGNLICKSLMNFGIEYYTKYVLQTENPLQRQRWFPFSRLFDNYHENLANNKNLYICRILVRLIEKKDSSEKLAIKLTYPTITPCRIFDRIVVEELFRKICNLSLNTKLEM